MLRNDTAELRSELKCMHTLDDKKTTCSTRDYKKQSILETFGSRILQDPSQIYSHNAWDHAEWDEAFEKEAKHITEMQSMYPVQNQDIYLFEAAEFWSKFYIKNGIKFFKDRRWLAQEFPEIFKYTIRESLPCKIAEIGCGVGNTILPILSENENRSLEAFAFDFAPSAIKLLKANPMFNKAPLVAEVWDLASEAGIPEIIKLGSIDLVVCIFCLSSLKPSEWQAAAENIWNMLKPGGMVIFRDYGRFDMTQLRFKKGHYICNNFYIRGDGTRVYFFTNEELENIFKKFKIIQNAVDKRLLINRKTKQKMYRCWLQLKAEKFVEK